MFTLEKEIMKRKIILVKVLFSLVCLTPIASANELAEYLAKGDFAAGIDYFEERENGGRESNKEKFSLGVLQFFEALEGLAQDFHRLGLDRVMLESGV